MISAFFARAVILVFGTLFPAYYSYKAVKTKNVKEYVKWMMYWIVFAFFTCAETITDLFLAFWFPFYYELKILLVLWLLSPATRGSSLLYRKFVHPWLTQREGEIDACIANAKEQGYSTVLTLGTKGVNYATSVIMQTAIKGGGGLVSQLKRSYSVGQLNESDETDTQNNNNNGKGNARYQRQHSSPTVAAITSSNDAEMIDLSGDIRDNNVVVGGGRRNNAVAHIDDRIDFGREGTPLRNGRRTNAPTNIDDVAAYSGRAPIMSARDRHAALLNQDNGIYDDTNDYTRDASLCFDDSYSQLRVASSTVLSPTVAGFSIEEDIREELQSSDDEYFPTDMKMKAKSYVKIPPSPTPSTRRSTRKRVQRNIDF